MSTDKFDHNDQHFDDKRDPIGEGASSHKNDESDDAEARQFASTDTPASEKRGTNSGPADSVPSLQRDAESRDLFTQSSYLRSWLLSDNSLNPKNLASALAAVLLVFIVFVYFTGQGETLAQDLLDRFYASDRSVEVEPTELNMEPSTAATEFALGQMAHHPDRLYQPYTSGQLLASGRSENSPLISQFRRELDMYTTRQGEDTNFDIRLFDNRNYEILEVYTLEDHKRRFEEAGEPLNWEWGEVNRARASAQRRLVDKYVERGIPRENVSVRWGRANQIREARNRELPYLEHEINLANYLGLSVLVTQLSVVETFNQDWLVSPVGARGRYQMMPYILRESDLHHFNLPTASGNTVQVMEERHPLLQMEPAFYLLNGYINAVGHELPGISAYHAGPGNIFMVLRQYLANATDHLSESSTVMDAYMWAITEGFDTVSSGTSFGNHSRSYVTSAYGSLRAMDDEPIDTSRTFQADRVQMNEGRTVQLSQLLRILREHDLYWGYDTDDLTAYQKFAEMNPHFRLPSADGEGVPVQGDIRISSTASGNPVRFFLPLGAVNILQENNLDVFDESATFRYDRNSFPDPNERQKTMWDRQYDQLVENIGRFGFTNENRQLLDELAARFDQLAERNPTHYRLARQRVIQIHRRLWRTRGWQRLADATSTALGTERPAAQPPSLPTFSPRSFTGELGLNN